MVLLLKDFPDIIMKQPPNVKGKKDPATRQQFSLNKGRILSYRPTPLGLAELCHG